MVLPAPRKPVSTVTGSVSAIECISGSTSGAAISTSAPSRTARKKQSRRPVWQATPSWSTSSSTRVAVAVDAAVPSDAAPGRRSRPCATACRGCATSSRPGRWPASRPRPRGSSTPSSAPRRCRAAGRSPGPARGVEADGGQNVGLAHGCHFGVEEPVKEDAPAEAASSRWRRETPRAGATCVPRHRLPPVGTWNLRLASAGAAGLDVVAVQFPLTGS